MSAPPKTPKLLLRLLSTQNDNAYSGDIEELFHFQVETLGPNRARRWYFWEVLKAVPRFILESIRWRFVMFKNAIKITLRNLQRHKGHSFINISGLIIGLSICMLMFLYIRFELSFDKFHNNARSIHRIISHDLGRDIHFAAIPALIAETLKEEFSEVRYAARVRRRTGYLKYEDQMFSESTIHYVDPDYLRIFTFPLAAGDARYLEDPFSLFISLEMAEKYFKDQDPVGCVLSLNNQREFIIRGILEKIPENSSIRFNMLASMSTLNTLWGQKFLNRWISHDFQTYLMLEPKANAGQFEENLNRYISPADKRAEAERDLFYSQQLSRIHFRSGLRFDDLATTDYRSIYMLAVISVVILLLAGLNYTTLATARATRRTREIGIRKVVGARKSSLVRQFLGESILAALISLIFSLVLVKSVLPVFNQLMDRNLSLSLLSDLPLFLGLTLIVGFAAGIYPALYLSSFQPSRIIKGTMLFRSKSSSILRKSLVVSQFVITIAILACLLFINQQIRFLTQNSMSRFENPILNIFISDEDLRNRHEPLLNAFLQTSGVLEGTASSHHPLRITGGTGITWEGEDRGHFSRFSRVDSNYFDFYGLKLKHGRFFSLDRGTDKTEAVIVNETAAGDSPWKNPVGKCCNIEGEGMVVGVVEDFHYRPLHFKVEPLTIRYISADSFLGGAVYISLKIDSNDIPGILLALEKTWKRFSPYFPFQHTFLDNTIDRIYRAESRLSRSLSSFAYIAIFLACLGLFGLTSFTVERRTKEIGIRKVLGATKRGILILLTKDILVWVGIAVVVAYPLAYYAIHEWLKKFAYRININPGPFIFATLFSLLIALLAMSFQSIKATTANPVDSLRDE